MQSGGASARAWNRQRHYALNLVVRGTGRLSDREGAEHPLDPGSVYQHVPGSGNKLSLSWDSDEPIEEWYIVLDRRLHQRLNVTGLFPPSPVFIPTAPDPAEAFRTLQERLEPLTHTKLVRRLPSALGCTLFALGQLFDLARPNDADQRAARAAQRARRWREQNLASREPLAALATRLGASYTTLARAFRAEFGRSLARYRIECRIAEAKRRLLHSPVATVASQLGYGDPFTFSTQFTQITGQSPSAYRREGKARP